MFFELDLVVFMKVTLDICFIMNLESIKKEVNTLIMVVSIIKCQTHRLNLT